MAPTEQYAFPWGRASALLAASLATLLGIARSVEPDVILERSLLAALITGLVIRLAIWMVASPKQVEN